VLLGPPEPERVRIHRALVHPLCLFLPLLLAPAAASGFTISDTVGDGTGEPLKWDTAEPVPFRFHYAGADELARLTMVDLMRQGFQTWADVPGAALSFEEGRIFVGPAAHHEGTDQVDGRSVIFFVESAWPHGGEVIALTSVSFAADGEILDSDLAFNSADHVFTTVDAGGAKDFLSIATHEAGHFVGLGHSAEADATMFAEYEDGDIFLRDLSPDDAAGLSALYPCRAEPCLGVVVWEDGKACDAGGAAPTVLALLLVGVALRRRRTGGALAVLGLAAVITLPGVADGTFVERLPVSVLGTEADAVVRARVVDTEAFYDGIVRTRVTLEVRETWAGESGGSVEIVVPGGLLDEPVEVIGPDGPLEKKLAGTRVFGAPRLVAGDEIVAFVDGSGIRGLSQGVFFVDGEQISRELSGLSFARVDGVPPLMTVAPGTVGELREMVERLER